MDDRDGGPLRADVSLFRFPTARIYCCLLASRLLSWFRMILVWESRSTFSFSELGLSSGSSVAIHPFAGVFTTCVEKHYPLIWFSPSFFLLAPTVLYLRRCRLSAEIYLDRSSTSTWSRVLCWWC